MNLLTRILCPEVAKLQADYQTLQQSHSALLREAADLRAQIDFLRSNVVTTQSERVLDLQKMVDYYAIQSTNRPLFSDQPVSNIPSPETNNTLTRRETQREASRKQWENIARMAASHNSGSTNEEPPLDSFYAEPSETAEGMGNGHAP